MLFGAVAFILVDYSNRVNTILPQFPAKLKNMQNLNIKS